MKGSGAFPDGLFCEKINERTGVVIATPVMVEFVEFLRSEGHYRVPFDTLGQRTMEMYIWDERGIYRDGAIAYIHRRVEAAHADRKLTAHRGFIEEVVQAVARRSTIPRKQMNPGGFLNLKNGVLELATGILHQHSPERCFTWQLATAFDPLARHDVFDKFLGEVLPRDSDRREIQKIFGYCFVPENPFQCAHLFVGAGCNGKSTVLSVLGALLGKENISAMTLQSLTENRFSMRNLYGKLANIFSDLPSNPLRYTGVFKALTGGDLIAAEAKFGGTIFFVNWAKLVFSANELPRVDDRTRAFWRRWYLIKFAQDITGREDRKLLKKLLEELPGILNWALAGIPLLEADGGFIVSVGAEDLKSEWVKRSDTLAWFVAERVEADLDGWIPKEDFYEAYAEFCSANKGASKSPEDVGKELPMHIPTVRTAKHRIDGRETRGWRGLRLLTSEEETARASAATSAAEVARTGAQRKLDGGVGEAVGTGETGGTRDSAPIEAAVARPGPGTAPPVAPVLPVSVGDPMGSGREAETGETTETGGPISVPGPAHSLGGTTNPEDLFGGRETKGDRARKAVGRLAAGDP
jgi:P4 family phage/plasmid primase-like protien